jgi:8-oxo-dGTP pyrophosphatase MutT (NUDIX family)
LDTDSVHTAVREFAEETGLASNLGHRQKQALVARLRAVFIQRGLYTAIRTNAVGFSAHVVLFDSAVQFERDTGLIGLVRRRTNKRVPRAEDKYNVFLSHETRGFTYVPLPLADVRRPAAPVAGARFVKSAVKLNKFNGNAVELRLRHGIANSALHSAMANL